MHRPHGHFARIKIGAISPAIGELNPCERPVGMNGVSHFAKARHVVFVPDAQFNERRNLGTMMNFHLLGENHPPAPFRFHPAHFSGSRRVAVATTIAVGHLIETVLGRHGAYFDGLKKDIIARVTHSKSLPAHSPC